MRKGIREDLLEEVALTGAWKMQEGSRQSMLGRGPDVNQSMTGRVSTPAGGGGQFDVGTARGCRGRSLA